MYETRRAAFKTQAARGDTTAVTRKREAFKVIIHKTVLQNFHLKVHYNMLIMILYTKWQGILLLCIEFRNKRNCQPVLSSSKGISLLPLATEFHLFSSIHIQIFTLITHFCSSGGIKRALVPDSTFNYAAATPE